MTELPNATRSGNPLDCNQTSLGQQRGVRLPKCLDKTTDTKASKNSLATSGSGQDSGVGSYNMDTVHIIATCTAAATAAAIKASSVRVGLKIYCFPVSSVTCH